MKKAIALILAALLALSMLAALAETEYTDKDTVKKVQQALNDAGYNCGTPDGIAGKKTSAAIMDYQASKGLEQTGTINDSLLASLGLAQAQAADAQTSDAVDGSGPNETVEKVQRALNGLGFDCGRQDGVMDENTRAAIMDYQGDAGLEMTGVIDEVMLEDLKWRGAFEQKAEAVEAQVDDDAEQPLPEAVGITFQSVPWGATPEQAQEILENNGFIGTNDLTNGFYDGPSAFWPEDENKMSDSIVSASAWVYGVGGQAEAVPLKLVGGQQCDDAIFSFLYSAEGEALDATPRLTFVTLMFSNGFDPDALAKQLEENYGKSERHTEKGMYTVQIWHGEAYTGICLISTPLDMGYLAYGKTDDYTKVNTLLDTLAAQEAADASAMEDAGL